VQRVRHRRARPHRLARHMDRRRAVRMSEPFGI
jgi:hypothetical protein